MTSTTIHSDVYIFTNEKKCQTHLYGDLGVPAVGRMMLDVDEKRRQAEAGVEGEVAREKDALDLAERVPRQGEVQGQT